MYLIKAIATLVVLGAVLVTVHLMKEYTGSVKDMPSALKEQQKEQELKLLKKAEKGALSSSEPGEKSYERACELLAENAMPEAEAKLRNPSGVLPLRLLLLKKHAGFWGKSTWSDCLILTGGRGKKR